MDSNWIYDPATLAIIIQFNIFNPNLEMLLNKRLVIEFIETGGFINFEHDAIMVNTRLYRNEGQYV